MGNGRDSQEYPWGDRPAKCDLLSLEASTPQGGAAFESLPRCALQEQSGGWTRVLDRVCRSSCNLL